MLLPERHAVRLGQHDGRDVFDIAIGLHEPVMGLAVVEAGPDPKVMFEEHGVGEVCNYMELHDDAELNPELGPRDVLQPEHRASLAARTQSDDDRVKLHAIAGAFALENADLVNEMLRSLRESVAATGGSVSLVQSHRRYGRRRAMIRVLHSAQAQPDRPVEDLLNEPQPLEEHAAGSESFVDHFFVPLMLIPSPFAFGAIASRAVQEASEAYTLLVTLGAGRGISLLDGQEISWSDVFGSSSMYRDMSLAGSACVAGKNQAFADLDFDELARWWVRKLNGLLTELTDLGRYRDNEHLNANAAYREARTIDRLFVTASRIQLHFREHVIRVAAAFELFDLLPELPETTIGARKAWDTLLNPARSEAIFERAFRDAPATIRDAFLAKKTAVWELLRNETVQTVVPGRGGDGWVEVGQARERTAVDEYMGRLYQSLRDTHHGYELNSPWKREILESHTGHISVALPELALLYVFALLADPAAGLGGAWFE